jgi:glycosyltransferase involved in cell wall biosynthesis
MAGLVVGIDASRNRSGGAIAHLKGILGQGDPPSCDISEVHVWSYRRLLDVLPDAPWLVKHNPCELEKSILEQVWWQFCALPKAARKVGCDVLFATDAATVCRFRPMVVLSQDMLSYESGVMNSYGFTKEWFRLLLILWIQNRAMKRADGVIFLTRYAKKVIQKSTGKLKRVAIIPHGVGNDFRLHRDVESGKRVPESSIQCLYVSNLDMYKHQWVVVRAVAKLRAKGYPVELTLAGGGGGRPKQLLDAELAACDPKGDFVKDVGFVRHGDLPRLLAEADCFIFASSCENLPVTLLEAMAAGLPIACSNRGPMPEVLEDGGVYFDPENSESISLAVEKLLNDGELRLSFATRAREIAEKYSWAGCAWQTWSFLRKTVSAK